MIYSEFTDFVQKYLAVIIATAVLLLVAVIIVVVSLVLRKKKPKVDNTDLLIEALGGIPNILSISCVRSRVTVKLKDKEKINRDGLNNVGVSSVIYMSDKVSLVFREDPSKSAQKIQNLL